MNKQVLVVDDTKNIRTLLARCLELEGYEVTAAANGREGLALMLERRYDLIFLDIKLPELSGTEVLRRMRSAGIQTPVVVITAYPTVKNAVECTRLGVASYLQKPFTAERLLNTLRELEQAAPENGPDSALEALEAGDGARALQLLSALLAEHPQDPVVYAGMAKAYRLLGDEISADKFQTISELFQ